MPNLRIYCSVIAAARAYDRNGNGRVLKNKKNHWPKDMLLFLLLYYYCYRMYLDYNKVLIISLLSLLLLLARKTRAGARYNSQPGVRVRRRKMREQYGNLRRSNTRVLQTHMRTLIDYNFYMRWLRLLYGTLYAIHVIEAVANSY